MTRGSWSASAGFAPAARVPPDRRRSRREFLATVASLAGGAGPLLLQACRAGGDGAERPRFEARGVVLVPDDLTLSDWPQRARAAGLDRIALHHGVSPAKVVDFVRSPNGAAFLAGCRANGLEVEYELHAMRELLPRELFAKEPALFRMNERGARIADANLCGASRRALDLAAENALKLRAALTPTTHRHFLWGDDGEPWCRCPACRELSDSDQALRVENALIAALRRADPRAELAHLAYANTLPPPRALKPEPGVFLEFAPLDLRYHRPLTALADPGNADVLAQLDANLAVFPRATAQALEYWLDDSMWSSWRRPAQPVRWNEAAFESDLDAYQARGVRRITSFAVYIDADYVQRFGFPEEVARYGRELSAPRTRRRGA